MLIRPSRATVGLASVVAAILIALPACDKKKEPNKFNEPPPDAGKQGSKSGPPPGFGPKEENQPKDSGAKTSGAGLPAPPKSGPQLQSTDQRNRQLSSNNLKQFGLAFHMSHDKLQSFPAAIADSTGKAGLSWRVALLPYLEEDKLYKQFKLNEPWDSENNKKLIAQMPKVYAAPGTDANGYTYYRSFSGQGAILTSTAKAAKPGDIIRGFSIKQITDGTSNTLLAAEASEPVIWTKPDDLPFAPGKSPKLGGAVFVDGFNALLCDGSVRYVKSTIDAKTLSNLIQANDGNAIQLP